MTTHRIASPFETPAKAAALGMRRRRPAAEDLAEVCKRLETLWGLDLHERDVQRLADGIVQRMTRLGLRSSSQYLLRLDDDEIETLTNLTTVGESWFFRDPGQMRLLRHLLLPKLIDARHAERRLRIWSAGCATGQEPWSLAMLLLELLPVRDGWNIQILGTDIDTQALATAAAGRYRGWALRGLSDASRSRYFLKRGDDWEVGAALRALVQFRRDNLAAGHAPPITDADLVLCRNVLIYLKRDRLAQVVSRFGAALHDGGLLIAGHCELIDVASDGFEVERFPESLVYRRQRISGAQAESGAAAETGTESVRSTRPRMAQRPDRTCPPAACDKRVRPITGSPVFKASAKQSPGARLDGTGSAAGDRSSKQVANGTPSSPAGTQGRLPGAAATNAGTAAALLQRAEEAAAKGDYAHARQAAEQASRMVPLDYRPRYLLAQLAELEDDSAEAQRWLSTVLYLVPDFIPAYLDAAAQCDRLQRPERASRYRRAARGLLGQLAPGEPLPPPYQHLRAATLSTYLDDLLGESQADVMIAPDAEDDRPATADE